MVNIAAATCAFWLEKGRSARKDGAKGAISMMLSAAFVAAVLLAEQAPARSEAPTAARTVAFEAAMAKGDYKAASAVAEEMIVERHRLPLAPDPLLNGFIGRLALAAGYPAHALAYLDLADSAGVPEPERLEARLALATAREQVGDAVGAGKILASLDSAPLGPAEKERVALARARLALADDPAAALAAVRPFLGSGRWQAETIAARAESLLGHAAEAREAADRAWTSAASAPPDDYAPAQVALVRAALAGAAGDRSQLEAMLTAGGAAANLVSRAATDGLPLCGEGGLGPSDAVTFTLFHGAARRQDLTPVAATRAAAVRPFLEALAGRDLLRTVSNTGGGTVLTVRCRPSLSLAYDAPRRTADPRTAWLAEHGLYEEITRAAKVEDINALSTELEQLSHDFGDDDVRLVPLRLQLAAMLESRARKEGDVEEWQVKDMQRKALAGVAKIGGGDGLFETDEDASAAEAIRSAGSFENSLALYRSTMLRRLRQRPLDEAYTAMLGWAAEDRDLPSAMQRQAANALLERFPAKSADKRRRALLLRLAYYEKEEDPKQARAIWREAGAPEDSCQAIDVPPKVESHSITDADYPHDPLRFSLEGTTVFEATIGADGRIVSSRLILSTPPLLFDDAIAAKFADFRLSPPRSGDRARACRGFIQPILWKLPEPPRRPSEDLSPGVQLPEKERA